MPIPRDEAKQSILSRLLEEHGLTSDSRLFREAERTSLASTGTPGSYRLAANVSPNESVIDVYGPGYLVQAEQVGPGLAFAESASPNWQETMEMRTLRAGGITHQADGGDRIEVEVRLEDILRQGGLMYPVESVMVERAWYFTLPHGSIEVREVA
jgi:cell division protein YceG involved in septum cleavage